MIEKLKDKYVFFDVDGTLSEYRYKDILYGGRCPELGCQSLEDLLFGNLFYRARPLKTMQNIIKNLDSDKIFILGAVTTNNEIEQKYQWLEENYPSIKKENIFFICSTMLKPEVITEYSKHFNIPLNKMVFVDDRLDVLRKAEESGITAYHPSSFTE
ncbi:MAG: HAD family hydrolase [Bacilli bacterium]|nr:HAD family hydrolase [Bacilli bacterium]